MDNDFLNLFIRNINKANLKNILEYHTNNPNITFLEYKKHKSESIGKETAITKKVYLDTKFWIEMRNAIHKSEPKKPKFRELFQILKNLVDQKTIICPFSDPLFDELLKQNIINSRKKTAQIVDILSNNYALNPMYHIMSCEIYNLVSYYVENKKLVKNYIWGKAISLLGDLDFNVESILGYEKELALKKACYDIYLNLTFQEIVAFTEKMQKDTSIADSNAAIINQIIATFSDGKVSFQELHKREILNSYESIAKNLNLATINFSNIVYKLGMEKLRVITPITYVYSAIYSHFRIDNKRRIKPNDYYDISNSSLAVGTCDYFFTENSFCKLLKSRKMDSKFNIVIESDISKIVQIMQDLL